MIRKRIVYCALALALMQMPHSRAFEISHVVDYICTNSSSISIYMLAVGVIFNAAAIFLHGKEINAIYAWQKKYEMYFRAHKNCNDEHVPTEQVPAGIKEVNADIDATKEKVPSNEVSTIVSEGVDSSPIGSVDANTAENVGTSVEQKTLVTVEMTPLYDQSSYSYDVYLQ